jgi:hypothetical protein
VVGSVETKYVSSNDFYSTVRLNSLYLDELKHSRICRFHNELHGCIALPLIHKYKSVLSYNADNVLNLVAGGYVPL